uniref:C-type lectin domain-containing protein n=1 Tax=Lygus hesperus TaxID=30085 RepID=A0A0K8S5Q3_LYGHE
MMYLSIPVILAHIVLFSTVHCVGAKKQSRKETLRSAVNNLKWTDSFGTYDVNLKAEILVHECSGELGSAQLRNGLLKSQVDGKDSRIRGLAKDTKSLKECNKNYEFFEKRLKEVGSKSNQTKEKCNPEDITSDIKNMNSIFMKKLQEDKDALLKHYENLVRKMEKDNKARMFGINLCENWKKTTDRILKIFKANGFPIESMKKLRKEQSAEGCGRRRRYLVIRQDTPWYEAMIQCEKLHMRLATINSEEENKEFVAALEDLSLIYAFAGGIEVDGKMTWSTGPMGNYTNWGVQPFPTKEVMNKTPQCLKVASSDNLKGKWYYSPCAEAKPYVCEAFSDY